MVGTLGSASRYVWINTGANEVMKDIIARAL
jgi:hypothetical protein